MILTGHQPEYLPYIGFFNKIMLADKFVFVDHIQFNKKSWQNRNKIRTKDGQQWITVPVLSKNKFEQKINEVEIDNTERWRKKHLKSIILNYQKAPYFKEYIGFFEDIYSRDWTKLSKLNIEIIKHLMKILDININTYNSSSLNLSGKKTDLLIDLCNALNADGYLSGSGGKGYINDTKFQKAGIKNLFREIKHPVYTQIYEPFISNMSVIDIIFNCGAEKARKIIYKCGSVK